MAIRRFVRKNIFPKLAKKCFHMSLLKYYPPPPSPPCLPHGGCGCNGNLCNCLNMLKMWQGLPPFQWQLLTGWTKKQIFTLTNNVSIKEICWKASINICIQEHTHKQKHKYRHTYIRTVFEDSWVYMCVLFLPNDMDLVDLGDTFLIPCFLFFSIPQENNRHESHV